MNFKTRFLAFTASALLAGSAGAVPILGSSLQNVLDSITDGGPSSIDVNTDQYETDEVWNLTASGGSISRLVIELAGSPTSGNSAFGIYDIHNKSNTIQLFSGGNQAGDIAFLYDSGGGSFTAFNPAGGSSFTETFTSSLFGFYLSTPNATYYSEAEQNTGDGQVDHMVAYQGSGDYLSLPGTSTPREWTPNEFVLAWEDSAGLGDQDFDDMMVLVESVIGVPEPSTLALFGIAFLGLGSLLRGKRRS